MVQRLGTFPAVKKREEHVIFTLIPHIIAPEWVNFRSKDRGKKYPKLQIST